MIFVYFLCWAKVVREIVSVILSANMSCAIVKITSDTPVFSGYIVLVMQCNRKLLFVESNYEGVSIFSKLIYNKVYPSNFWKYSLPASALLIKLDTVDRKSETRVTIFVETPEIVVCSFQHCVSGPYVMIVQQNNSVISGWGDQLWQRYERVSGVCWRRGTSRWHLWLRPGLGKQSHLQSVQSQTLLPSINLTHSLC